MQPDTSRHAERDFKAGHDRCWTGVHGRGGGGLYIGDQIESPTAGTGHSRDRRRFAPRPPGPLVRADDPGLRPSADLRGPFHVGAHRPLHVLAHRDLHRDPVHHATPQPSDLHHPDQHQP